MFLIEIVELIFFTAGIWLIFSGRVPEKLLKVFFGRGQYLMTSTKVRLFGIVLASPSPVIFIVLHWTPFCQNFNSIGYSTFLETVYVIAIAIIAIVAARKIRQPEGAQQTVVEKEQKPSLLMSIDSLGMGILAILPYLYVAKIAGIYQPRIADWLYCLDSFFTITAFKFGFISGLPFGITGIILGIRSWRRSPRNKKGVVIAAIGIILSVSGIIGHVWFFAACVFCQ